MFLLNQLNGKFIYMYLEKIQVKMQVLVFCFQNCSDLLWEKNVLMIEILNNNLFEQWKVRPFFETERFFNLFLEVSQI